MGQHARALRSGFLFLDGSIDKITLHHELWTVVGLRLLEVIAVVLIGYGVSMLAEGFDATRARRLSWPP